jgi:hypothetical protein
VHQSESSTGADTIHVARVAVPGRSWPSSVQCTQQSCVIVDIASACESICLRDDMMSGSHDSIHAEDINSRDPYMLRFPPRRSHHAALCDTPVGVSQSEGSYVCSAARNGKWLALGKRCLCVTSMWCALPLNSLGVDPHIS